jgi:hypothetical protein
LTAIPSWEIQLLRISSLSLSFNPELLRLVGLILSIVDFVKIKKNGKSGKRLARAGIILTILHAALLTALVLLLIIAISKHME